MRHRREGEERRMSSDSEDDEHDDAMRCIRCVIASAKRIIGKKEIHNEGGHEIHAITRG